MLRIATIVTPVGRDVGGAATAWVVAKEVAFPQLGQNFVEGSILAPQWLQKDSTSLITHFGVEDIIKEDRKKGYVNSNLVFIERLVVELF